MSISATLYGGVLESLANKEIDLGSDTLNVMLLTSSYVPSDTHRYLSDLTGEAVGTGYTSGGKTLTGVTVTYNTGTKTLTVDADDISWSSSTLTARYAAIVDVTPGSASTNPLISYVDFGADVSDTNGTFQINWNAAGIATVSHA
ncbi:Gp27 protein [Mycobacterium intracellulare subsp. yongonense 05-1390]|uniref:hypothetical protein n=1 Tax=Mycobacterium TaxID=1763 RepID=UPI0003555805|nr:MULTISPECIES: hypothetical protein [Mycobacterium]AGP64930.1 Gp27 protein [Mycobacterium intracellulare subsp. yongonense 05-1390]ARR79005.1 hypothetical protein MOTT12_03341 [Mycobacterium intracellulare subsp. yongonense]ARR84072.1 hypothetical protein MOTT27_03251 [Mycobacterium intracellulare subsp. yongonense]KEF99958.1 hypothetical protein K883_00004 [Mycobacterium sp. TKK-01-0059]OCB10729.1 hypothetical protein A5644_04295 [Mycobacterium intracellulare subsp. yongonense]